MAVRNDRLDDPAAFQRLYAEHVDGVYRAAHAVLHDSGQAEDVVQDVFLSLWRRPERYDARRGQIGPYLRLLARSRALDAWRTGRCGQRAHERLREGAQLDPPVAADASRDAEVRERSALVGAAVRRLPEPQREAITLAYWAGLTAGDLAERSDIPLGTAKSRLRLGLAKLRADVALAEA